MMLKTIALALASFFGFFGGGGHLPPGTVTHAAVVVPSPNPFPTCPPLPRVPILGGGVHTANALRANSLPHVHPCPL